MLRYRCIFNIPLFYSPHGKNHMVVKTSLSEWVALDILSLQQCELKIPLFSSH